ncbi:PREDICTED: uncharacterized protein LOC108382264, partial [Rhagoletis zephyria]|uniref:uncharacterized protein LOC108382264 n=1 Tax=Rhagoletis zephyria TaxID=28612 RepID=UPI0008118353
MASSDTASTLTAKQGSSSNKFHKMVCANAFIVQCTSTDNIKGIEKIVRLSNGNWNCPVTNCKYSDRNFNNIKTHYRTHFKTWKPYKCVCKCLKKAQFGNRLNAKKHLQKIHKIERKEHDKFIQENEEMIKFENEIFANAVRIEQAQDLSKATECDECGKLVRSLKDHKKQVHDEKKFVCQEKDCFFKTANKNSFLKHVAHVHYNINICKFVQLENIDSTMKKLIIAKLKMGSPQGTSFDENDDLNESPPATTEVKPKNLFYCKEIQEIGSGQFDWEKARLIETTLSENKGKIKDNDELSSFVYFLLDPKIADDLIGMIPDFPKINFEKFKLFVSSIFYCNKGIGKETFSSEKQTRNMVLSGNAKEQKILEIEQSGKLSSMFQIFHGLSDTEASTRSSILITTLSMNNLTNSETGIFKSPVKLTIEEQRKVGAYWLYKAFIGFSVTGVSRSLANPKTKVTLALSKAKNKSYLNFPNTTAVKQDYDEKTKGKKRSFSETDDEDDDNKDDDDENDDDEDDDNEEFNSFFESNRDEILEEHIDEIEHELDLVKVAKTIFATLPKK